MSRPDRSPAGTPAMPAAELLRSGRTHQQAGRLDDALSMYAEAVRLAEQSRDRAVLVEALRRLGVIQHMRNEPAAATATCRRSFSEAFAMDDPVLAGEALNTLAGFRFEGGDMTAAQRLYEEALTLAGDHQGLRGRVEQNLGIMASVQGNYAEALTRYRASLEAFERAGDERGTALAWHNLGLIRRAQGELDLAVRNLTVSSELAEKIGDVHLAGLCSLSRAEVFHMQQRYAEAKTCAEAALAVFEQLGAPMDQSGAHRLLGMIARDTGAYEEATTSFRAAIHLAVATQWVLGQAEALREMALLNEESGRRSQALSQLSAARGLFTQVEAREDLADVARRISKIEAV